jgi:hypothetical protein
MSMRAAVARYRVWEDERSAWAAAHGLDECDVETVFEECGKPWDEDAI